MRPPVRRADRAATPLGVQIGTVLPGDESEFHALRNANQARLRASEYYADKVEAGPEWWALCMAGEAGETCDAVKKYVTRFKRRPINREDIGKEIADTIVYLDLLAASLGLDLWQCVREKFNEVSDRIGSDVKL